MSRKRKQPKPKRPQTKARKKYQRYTEDFKALALAAVLMNGGNVHHTAKTLGVPVPTLASWVYGKVEIDSEIQHLKKYTLAEMVETLAKRIASMSAEHFGNQQLGVSFGIIMDKLDTLRNQLPTKHADEDTAGNRIDPDNLSPDELQNYVYLHSKLRGVEPPPRLAPIESEVTIYDEEPADAADHAGGQTDAADARTAEPPAG